MSFGKSIFFPTGMSHSNLPLVGSSKYSPGFDLRDIHSMGVIGTPLSHGGCVNVLKWKKDGTRIITGSDDRLVKVWDTSKGLDRFPLVTQIVTSHGSNIFDVEIHEALNPNTIFSCAADGLLISNDIDRPRSGQGQRLYMSYNIIHMFLVSEFDPHVIYTAEACGLISRIDLRSSSTPSTLFRNKRRLFGNSNPRLCSVKAIAQSRALGEHSLLFGGAGVDIRQVDMRMINADGERGGNRGIVRQWGPQFLSERHGCWEDKAPMLSSAMSYLSFKRQCDVGSALQQGSLSLSGMQVSENGRTLLASFQGDQIYTFDLFGKSERELVECYYPPASCKSSDNAVPEGETSEQAVSSSSSATDGLASARSPNPNWDAIYSFQSRTVNPWNSEHRRKISASCGSGVGAMAAYGGHVNYQTFLKQVAFFGPKDEYIVSGSDSGDLFIWDSKSGQLFVDKKPERNENWVSCIGQDGSEVNRVNRVVKLATVDKRTCNGVVPHPYAPILASYGIDSYAKVLSINARLHDHVSSDEEDDDDIPDSDSDDFIFRQRRSRKRTNESISESPSASASSGNFHEIVDYSFPSSYTGVGELDHNIPSLAYIIDDIYTRECGSIENIHFDLENKRELFQYLLEFEARKGVGYVSEKVRVDPCQVASSMYALHQQAYCTHGGSNKNRLSEYLSLDIGPMFPTYRVFEASAHGLPAIDSLLHLLEVACPDGSVLDRYSAFHKLESSSRPQQLQHIWKAFMDSKATEFPAGKLPVTDTIIFVVSELHRIAVAAKNNGNAAFKNKDTDIALYFYVKAHIYSLFIDSQWGILGNGVQKRRDPFMSELVWGRCGCDLMFREFYEDFIAKAKANAKITNDIDSNSMFAYKGMEFMMHCVMNSGGRMTDRLPLISSSASSSRRSNGSSDPEESDMEDSDMDFGIEDDDDDDDDDEEEESSSESTESHTSSDEWSTSTGSPTDEIVVRDDLAGEQAVAPQDCSAPLEACAVSAPESPSPVSNGETPNDSTTTASAAAVEVAVDNINQSYNSISEAAGEQEVNEALTLKNEVLEFLFIDSLKATLNDNTQLQLVIMNNVLALYIQEKRFLKAGMLCVTMEKYLKARNLQADAKFFFRRALVHQACDDPEAAFMDIKEAHRLQPNDQAIAKKLKEFKSVADAARKKQSKKFSKFFSGEDA